MYYCSDLDQKEKQRFSCKGIQHKNNNMTFNRFEDVLLLVNGVKDRVLNKGFRYIEGKMRTYKQEKKVYHMYITRR